VCVCVYKLRERIESDTKAGLERTGKIDAVARQFIYDSEHAPLAPRHRPVDRRSAVSAITATPFLDREDTSRRVRIYMEAALPRGKPLSTTAAVALIFSFSSINRNYIRI